MENITDPTILTMVSTLFVAVVGILFHQSRENAKTRDLIMRSNSETHRELKDLSNRVSGLEVHVSELQRTTDKRFDELRVDHQDLKDTVESNHNEVCNALGQTRERLARIEGHLGLSASATEVQSQD